MLSYSRHKQLYNSLTQVAAKVYDAVPLQEPWTKQQVISELTRCGTVRNIQTIEGCLNSLKNHGLIKEPKVGLFVRVPYKTEPVQVKTPENTMAQSAPATPDTKQRSPIDTLTQLTSRVSAAIGQLKTLASEIEDAALEIEEQFRANEEEMQRFQQLKTLLKNI